MFCEDDPLRRNASVAAKSVVYSRIDGRFFYRSAANDRPTESNLKLFVNSFQ